MALVVALWTALLILLISGATGMLIHGRGRSAAHSVDSQLAACMAESGIEYARGVLRSHAEALAAATPRKGTRTPTMRFEEVLSALGARPVEGRGYVVGPIEVPDVDGVPLGRFELRVALEQATVDPSEAPSADSLAAPAGLAWLPALLVESVGAAGRGEGSRRRLLANLRPLPPAVLAPAGVPSRALLEAADPAAEEPLAEADLAPSLPEYSAPDYEITTLTDLGVAEPHLWVLPNHPEAPPVYPPTSSLPGQPAAPWWFCPVPEEPGS